MTVLDPSGSPARIAKGREIGYQPYSAGDNGKIPVMVYKVTTLFDPLAPGESVSWEWKVGDEFDMSAPGTYQIGFGGRVAFLDTTVCSNALELKVAK